MRPPSASNGPTGSEGEHSAPCPLCSFFHEVPTLTALRLRTARAHLRGARDTSLELRRSGRQPGGRGAPTTAERRVHRFIARGLPPVHRREHGAQRGAEPLPSPHRRAPRRSRGLAVRLLHGHRLRLLQRGDLGAHRLRRSLRLGCRQQHPRPLRSHRGRVRRDGRRRTVLLAGVVRPSPLRCALRRGPLRG